MTLEENIPDSLGQVAQWKSLTRNWNVLPTKGIACNQSGLLYKPLLLRQLIEQNPLGVLVQACLSRNGKEALLDYCLCCTTVGRQRWSECEQTKDFIQNLRQPAWPRLEQTELCSEYSVGWKICVSVSWWTTPVRIKTFQAAINAPWQVDWLLKSSWFEANLSQWI